MKAKLFFIAALFLASTYVYAQPIQMKNYYFFNIKGQVGFLVDLNSDRVLIPTYQTGLEWKAQINTFSSSYGSLFLRINSKDNVSGVYEGGFKMMWSAFNAVDEDNGILSLGPFGEMSFSSGHETPVLNYIIGGEFTYKTGAWIEVFVNTSKNLNLFTEEGVFEGGWLVGLGLAIDLSQTWKK